MTSTNYIIIIDIISSGHLATAILYHQYHIVSTNCVQLPSVFIYDITTTTTFCLNDQELARA